MEQLSFVYDFLLILSEVGLNGIRCAMPLIKMQFAAVLIQLETTPLKDARISASTVMKLGQIFAIFIGVSEFCLFVIDLKHITFVLDKILY